VSNEIHIVATLTRIAAALDWIGLMLLIVALVQMANCAGCGHK